MSFAFHPNFAGDPKAPGYGVFYTIDTSRPSGTATLAGKGPTVDHDNVVHEFRVADPRRSKVQNSGSDVSSQGKFSKDKELGHVGSHPEDRGNDSHW